MKHTPGPWTLSQWNAGWDVLGEPCRGFTNGIAIVFSRNNDAQESNARLIAAAPDLLGSLQDMVREFVDSTQPLNQQFDSAIVIKAVEHARAAIAKATGETK